MTLIDFPKPDPYRQFVRRDEPAIIIVLPVVRIERDDGSPLPHRQGRGADPWLCAHETFAHMRQSFDQLREALLSPGTAPPE